MVKIKALKKPNIKDYMCDECGIVHDWAYKEALKQYNLKLKVAKQK